MKTTNNKIKATLSGLLALVLLGLGACGGSNFLIDGEPVEFEQGIAEEPGPGGQFIGVPGVDSKGNDVLLAIEIDAQGVLEWAGYIPEYQKNVESGLYYECSFSGCTGITVDTIHRAISFSNTILTFDCENQGLCEELGDVPTQVIATGRITYDIVE